MATVTFDHATRVCRDGDRPAMDRLDLEINDGGVGSEDGLEATVDVVEELGSEPYRYCTAQGMNHQEVVVWCGAMASAHRSAATR